MRASCATSTVRASGHCSNTSSAAAARLLTGITGRSIPYASPCATPHATRKPVKPPGPAPKAIASHSPRLKERAENNSATIERICSVWRCPTSRAISWIAPPVASATEHTEVAVSKASRIGARGIGFTLVNPATSAPILSRTASRARRQRPALHCSGFEQRQRRESTAEDALGVESKPVTKHGRIHAAKVDAKRKIAVLVQAR